MSAIDVVMTVWNTPGQWVTEAIESVRSQYDDRLIVWDDGSTRDDTVATVENYTGTRGSRINQGVGIASNWAIACGTAPLIARLDADDRMMPGTLDVLRTYLEAHPEVDVVSGWMHYIKPDGSRFAKQPTQPPEMHASPTHENRIVHSGCMFRRALWERAGGYPDRKGARGTDWYFWERCQAAGARFSVLPHYVIERRIHPDSHSFRKSKHLQDWWRKANA